MSTPNTPSSTTLSSRCSICFTSTPKYRCPRCGARTCSLNCVQKHKSRSLCSGIRDPTRYLSRRQLATEKAFDSDFNLIAGIERGVERAERVFAVPNQNREAERRIRKAIEHAGVQVWRAPKGVKRARENRTGLDGRRQYIRWTVEWRFLGMSVVSSASELASIVQAHDVAVMDAYTASSDQARQRKVGEYARSVGVLIPSGYKGRRDLIDVLDWGTLAKLEDGQGDAVVNEATQESTAHTGDSHSNGAVFSSDCEASEAALASNTDTNTQNTNTIRRRFFIHRPEISPAKKQVVSPVDGTSILGDILKGKTVREFPTFLVEVSDSDQIDWRQWHVNDEIDKSEIVQT